MPDLQRHHVGVDAPLRAVPHAGVHDVPVLQQGLAPPRAAVGVLRAHQGQHPGPPGPRHDVGHAVGGAHEG
ncbi:MAG: hypothetical protein ACK55I_28915, partial [bacterium]